MIEPRSRHTIGIVAHAAFWDEHRSQLMRSVDLAVTAFCEPGGLYDRRAYSGLPSHQFYDDAGRIVDVSNFDGAVFAHPSATGEMNRALSGGMRIFDLKPHQLSAGDISRLGNAEKAGGSLYDAVQPRRLEQPFRLVADIIRDGRLGAVSRVTCEVSDEEACFGALDLCRQWLGEPLSLSADVERSLCEGHERLSGSIILTHAVAQSIHHIRATRRGDAGERYLVEGSAARLEVSRPPGAKTGVFPFDLTLARNGRPARDFGGWIGAQKPLRELIWEHVAAALRGDEGPVSTWEDVSAVRSVLDAAEISSSERTKVSLPAVPVTALRPLAR